MFLKYFKLPYEMSKTWFSLKDRSQMCYVLSGTELSSRINSTQLTTETFKHAIIWEIC